MLSVNNPRRVLGIILVFLQIRFKPDLNMLMVIVVNIIEAFYHFKYFILLQLAVKFNVMVKVPKFYSSRDIHFGQSGWKQYL